MIALAFPLTISPGGSVASTTNYDQIVRQQVLAALMTNNGERIFQPQWGCNLQAMIHDPSDELVRMDMASQIKERLKDLVPRAIIQSVKMETDSDPSTVRITIIYRASLYDTDKVMDVSLNPSGLVNRQALLTAGQ